jgi:hypothetical protein
MLATNLSQVERGSWNRPGESQLNSPLVSYYYSGWVRLVAHSWRSLRRTWLLVETGRSRRQKERTAAIAYPQPRENRVVATIVLATHYHVQRRQRGFYRHRDHPGGRLPPPPSQSHRRSQVLIWFCTRCFVLCQRFALATELWVTYKTPSTIWRPRTLESRAAA